MREASSTCRETPLCSRETYLTLLSAKLPEGALREELQSMGLEGNFADALAKAVLDKAIEKSDMTAAKFIQEVLAEKGNPAVPRGAGERPLRSLELETLTDEELAALADLPD